MSVDVAVAWVFLPDVSAQILGLTNATPALQVYAGLSQRF
jgi:hypothetical protein